jgi:hypothetical protein
VCIVPRQRLTRFSNGTLLAYRRRVYPPPPPPAPARGKRTHWPESFIFRWLTLLSSRESARLPPPYFQVARQAAR